MRMRRLAPHRLILIGLGLIIAGALVFRLFTDLERYDRVVEIPPSSRAVNDPFLAFRRWLGANGITVDDVELRRILTEEVDLGAYGVIFLDRRRTPEIWDDAVFQDWMSQGGHLVFFHTPRMNDEPAGEAQPSPVLNDITVLWDWKDTSEENDSSVTLDDTVVFRSGTKPDPARSVRLGRTREYGLITVPVAHGWLTVTGRPLMLTNDFIGEEDNAVLVWDLVRRGSAAEGPVTERILFLMGEGATGLMSEDPWIAVILISLMALLALVLWRFLARRESALDPPGDAGSDIAHRLAAEGAFFRRYGILAPYLKSSRTDILRKLKRAGLTKASGSMKYAEASLVLGRSEEELRDLFDVDEIGGRKEFLHRMRQFYGIKKALP